MKFFKSSITSLLRKHRLFLNNERINENVTANPAIAKIETTKIEALLTCDKTSLELEY